VAKKKHAEEHENHERWLVSYADFITLLFAFFVVMYSVSRVDNKKLQQTAASIKWALHMAGAGGTQFLPIFQGPEGTGQDLGTSTGNNNGARGQRRAIELLRQRIEHRLRPMLIGRETAVTVVAEGQRLSIRLAASHVFDAGQAALRPEALPVLDAVMAELKPLDRAIRVEGHTDNAPLSSPRFRNNWDLSAARAATVVAYVEEAHQVKPSLLSAVGRGSTRPVATGDSPEAREANRRLELVVELSTDEEVVVGSR